MDFLSANTNRNITMKYKELITKKIDISMQYEYISEKELIDQAFEETYQLKMSENNLLRNLNNSIQSIFSIGNERSRVERYCVLAEAIQNK